ncbi:helix-turn-helix domain-containing protein [Eubacteriales bacterium OttesenSCG-928-N13]|nr:helix-turn-helix domain-containing protein [Eubacteriales bacterium OttesenSCG-928-N13]
MTTGQRAEMLMMRQSGRRYAEIARELGLSVNTVKSHGRRAGYGTDGQTETAPPALCKQCGARYPVAPGRKRKRFCSDRCRITWWNHNRARLKSARSVCCAGCGTMFMAAPGQQYCAHGCYVRARFEGALK